MPQKTITAILECAGNGRRHFAQSIEGEVRWGEGAVGNATWTGVPLSYLLQEHGDSDLIYFEGLDRIEGEKPRFVRYLPAEKALDQNTLIALRMNDEVLSATHGFPARLIVPGWYAMASVKWLCKIKVSKHPKLPTYFNDSRYVYANDEDPSRKEPVREINVKSMIDSPRENQTIRAGTSFTVRGKAWSGFGRISKVEVKLSSEDKWSEAEIEGPSSPYSWTFWKKDCILHEPNTLTICVRATDEFGNVQPDVPMANKFQYGYNAITRRIVNVVDSKVPRVKK